MTHTLFQSNQPTTRTRIRQPHIIGAIAILLLLTAALGYWRLEYNPNKAIIKPSAVVKQVEAPPTPAPAPKSSGPTAEELARGLVGDGGSIERSLIQHVIADPTAYGFDDDTSDAKAVKKFAGKFIALLAHNTGVVDGKFGGEIRVKTAKSVSYLIEKNATTGKFQIVTYTRNANGTFTRDTTYSTLDHPHFLGVDQRTGEKLPVPSYEYVFLPGV